MLYNALREGTRIVVVGDFDADGTSTALSVLSLRALGCENVTYLVPNRFEDGYGLSPVVDQAHARGAQMILTVDNGSPPMRVSITRISWGSRCWLPITTCRVKRCRR